MNTTHHHDLQCFLKETWGLQTWLVTLEAAELDFRNYKQEHSYPADELNELLRAAAHVTGTSYEGFLCDFEQYCRTRKLSPLLFR